MFDWVWVLVWICGCEVGGVVEVGFLYVDCF